MEIFELFSYLFGVLVGFLIAGLFLRKR